MANCRISAKAQDALDSTFRRGARFALGVCLAVGVASPFAGCGNSTGTGNKSKDLSGYTGTTDLAGSTTSGDGATTTASDGAIGTDAASGSDGAIPGGDGGPPALDAGADLATPAIADMATPVVDMAMPAIADLAVAPDLASPCGACPAGYACGTANGLPVCRAPSGVPLFSSTYLILMENTSLSTLQDAMSSGAAPSLAALGANNATGSDYHGVAHPSLPNYIALTSGDTQGIGCDCNPVANSGSCNFLTCNLVLGSCSCDQPAMNIADQLEAAGKTWMAFGEDMHSACNLVDSGNYAVRHVPFLYYDDIQGSAARCGQHVVDYSNFNVATPAQFNYLAPNLIDDMHNPFPATTQNITNGDDWIGPQLAAIMGSKAYTDGGLVVVVWDEDDDSGGLTGSDDPIAIFLMSPYAKAGGYVSAVTADHYSLLATFEDGLGLARLGKAGTTRSGMADTLSDYFPSK